MDNFLRRLFGGDDSGKPGRPHPLAGNSDSLPSRVELSDLPTPAGIHPKVLAIIHNPVIHAKGGRKAQSVYGWQDPDKLAQGYIDDLKQVSNSYLNYQI